MIKRKLNILCSLLLIVALLGIQFSSGAMALPQSDQKVTAATEQFVTDNADKNVIKGTEPLEWGGYKVTAGKLVNLTDASLAEDNCVTFSKNGDGGPTLSYMYLAFDLKGTVTIDQILYAGFNSATLYNQEYCIYVGDTLEGLFDDANYVSAHTETGATVGQLFTYSKKPTGHYLGIMVNGASDSLIRLTEFGVYGTSVANNFTYETTDNAFAADNKDSNLLLKADNPEIGGGYLCAKGCELLYDGTTKHVTFNTIEGGTPEQFMTLTYNMNGTATISKLLNWSHKSYHVPAYEIYVSNSDEDLFNKSNLVATYATSPTLQLPEVITFEKGKEPVGSYVGYKILAKNQSDVTVRMRELAIYGSVVSNATYTVDNADAAYVSDHHSENLLTKAASPALTDELGEYSYVLDPNSNIDNLTDGIIGSNDGHVTISPMGATTKMHLTYDMNADVTVHKLLFGGYKDEPYRVTSYKIYVSESLDTLYNENSRVVYYHEPTSAAQLFTFFENKRPVGRYLGIEVIKPNRTDSCIRLDEVAVYGTSFALSTYTTTNADKNTVALKANDNQLVYAKPATFDKVKYTQDPDCQISGMIDGNMDIGTHATFSLNQAKYDGQFQLTYDMRTAVTVDSMLFASLNGKSYYTAHYSLFLSDSLDNLFDGANRVVVYKAPTSAGQVFTFPDGHKPVGRYFGVQVEKANYVDTYVRIDQLAVYGTPAEKLAKYDTINAKTFIDESKHLKVNILRKDVNDDALNTDMSLQVKDVTIDDNVATMAKDYYYTPYGSGIDIHLVDADGKDIDWSTLDGRTVQVIYSKPEDLIGKPVTVFKPSDSTLNGITGTQYSNSYINLSFTNGFSPFSIFIDNFNHGFNIGVENIMGQVNNSGSNNTPISNNDSSLTEQSGSTATIGTTETSATSNDDSFVTDSSENEVDNVNTGDDNKIVSWMLVTLLITTGLCIGMKSKFRKEN